MLTDFQETTAGASTLGRIMSSRGRKNLPVGSLIFSSAEAHAIRDKASPHFLAHHAAPDKEDAHVGLRGRRVCSFTIGNYFADAGNAANLSTSRASCWMMTVALRFAAIFLRRSSDATVWARSKLNAGTPSES